MQRPVVEFSLEKRAALKAKEKRTERSRVRLKEIQQEDKVAAQTSGRKEKKKGKKVEKSDTTEAASKKKIKKSDKEEAVPEFGGLASKVGLATIPSMKPKGMKMIRKSVKPKIKKLLPRRKRERKSQPGSDKAADDHFEKQLSSYKKKNYAENTSTTPKKAKWYS